MSGDHASSAQHDQAINGLIWLSRSVDTSAGGGLRGEATSRYCTGLFSFRLEICTISSRHTTEEKRRVLPEIIYLHVQITAGSDLGTRQPRERGRYDDTALVGTPVLLY